MSTLENAATALASTLDPHECHIGIGDNTLHVYVTKKNSQSHRAVKNMLAFDGFPLVVVYVGKVKPAQEARHGQDCECHEPKEGK